MKRKIALALAAIMAFGSVMIVPAMTAQATGPATISGILNEIPENQNVVSGTVTASADLLVAPLGPAPGGTAALGNTFRYRILGGPRGGVGVPPAEASPRALTVEAPVLTVVFNEAIPQSAAHPIFAGETVYNTLTFRLTLTGAQWFVATNTIRYSYEASVTETSLSGALRTISVGTGGAALATATSFVPLDFHVGANVIAPLGGALEAVELGLARGFAQTGYNSGSILPYTIHWDYIGGASVATVTVLSDIDAGDRVNIPLHVLFTTSSPSVAISSITGSDLAIAADTHNLVAATPTPVLGTTTVTHSGTRAITGGGAFISVNDIVITENVPGTIRNNSLLAIQAPAGWQFAPSSVDAIVGYGLITVPAVASVVGFGGLNVPTFDAAFVRNDRTLAQIDYNNLFALYAADAEIEDGNVDRTRLIVRVQTGNVTEGTVGGFVITGLRLMRDLTQLGTSYADWPAGNFVVTTVTGDRSLRIVGDTATVPAFAAFAGTPTVDAAIFMHIGPTVSPAGVRHDRGEVNTQTSGRDFTGATHAYDGTASVPTVLHIYENVANTWTIAGGVTLPFGVQFVGTDGESLAGQVRVAHNNPVWAATTFAATPAPSVTNDATRITFGAGTGSTGVVGVQIAPTFMAAPGFVGDVYAQLDGIDGVEKVLVTTFVAPLVTVATEVTEVFVAGTRVAVKDVTVTNNTTATQTIDVFVANADGTPNALVEFAPIGVPSVDLVDATIVGGRIDLTGGQPPIGISVASGATATLRNLAVVSTRGSAFDIPEGTYYVGILGGAIQTTNNAATTAFGQRGLVSANPVLEVGRAAESVDAPISFNFAIEDADYVTVHGQRAYLVASSIFVNNEAVELYVTVNGEVVPKSVLNINGRTFVPLRALANAVVGGPANINWAPQVIVAGFGGAVTGAATVTIGGQSATFYVYDVNNPLTQEVAAFVDIFGNLQLNPADSDGQSIAAFTFEGATYVPFRAFGYAFGIPVGTTEDDQAWFNLAPLVEVDDEEDDEEDEEEDEEEDDADDAE